MLKFLKIQQVVTIASKYSRIPYLFANIPVKISITLDTFQELTEECLSQLLRKTARSLDNEPFT